MFKQTELAIILAIVAKREPMNDADVRQILDSYFGEIVWSILKDEYEKTMSEEEKAVLCNRILDDVQRRRKDEER